MNDLPVHVQHSIADHLDARSLARLGAAAKAGLPATARAVSSERQEEATTWCRARLAEHAAVINGLRPEGDRNEIKAAVDALTPPGMWSYVYYQGNRRAIAVVLESTMTDTMRVATSVGYCLANSWRRHDVVGVALETPRTTVRMRLRLDPEERVWWHAMDLVKVNASIHREKETRLPDMVNLLRSCFHRDVASQLAAACTEGPM